MKHSYYSRVHCARILCALMKSYHICGNCISLATNVIRHVAAQGCHICFGMRVALIFTFPHVLRLVHRSAPHSVFLLAVCRGVCSLKALSHLLATDASPSSFNDVNMLDFALVSRLGEGQEEKFFFLGGGGFPRLWYIFLRNVLACR